MLGDSLIKTWVLISIAPRLGHTILQELIDGSADFLTPLYIRFVWTVVVPNLFNKENPGIESGIRLAESKLKSPVGSRFWGDVTIEILT